MSRVTRDDLEGKLRQIQSDLDDTATAAAPAALSTGVAVVAAAVGLAYVIGQRKARKQTTVVEIRRV